VKSHKSIRLETPRLVLRPYRMSDADEVTRQLQRRVVTRYTYIPHPYQSNDYYQFLRRLRSPKFRRHNIVFAIVDRTTNKVIGAVGVHGMDFKNKSTEIGYWLAKSYWGQGIVVEALIRVVDYLFTGPTFHRVFARVFHPNTRSARVLEKAGFTQEGRLRKAVWHNNQWMDMLYFGLLREDWSKIKKTRRSKRAGSI